MASSIGDVGRAGTTPATASQATGGGAAASPTQKSISQGCGMMGGGSGVGGAAGGGAVEGASRVPGNDLGSVLKGLNDIVKRLSSLLEQMASTSGGGGKDAPTKTPPKAIEGGGAGVDPEKGKKAEGGGAGVDPKKAKKPEGSGGCGCGSSGDDGKTAVKGAEGDAPAGKTGVKGVQGEAAPDTYVAPAVSQAVETGSKEDDAFEQRVLDLVNQERANAGLRSLRYNGRLDAAAEKHAAHQARVGIMAHDGIGDATPGDRIRAEGFRNSWGENVAVGQRSPEQVVREWMASPTHRANILNPKFTQLGVGLQAAANGTPYWAQEFGAG